MPAIATPLVPGLAPWSPLAPGGLPATSSQLADIAIRAFGVPPFLLPIYQAAGTEYGVPWEVLAAINEIETDYGRNLSTSSAGAVGWMQFMPSTWARYGLDVLGNGTANPYNPVDAIFAAARLLQAAGAAHDLPGAIFAYNHAGWYVNSVQLRAQLLTLMPASIVDGLTGLMDARFPVAGHLGHYAASAPTQVGTANAPAVSLAAPGGAPVIAVADGRVMAFGRDARRGRYLVLEDSYGNTFTYSHLGSLQANYPVLTPRAAPWPAPAPSSTGTAAHVTATKSIQATTTAPRPQPFMPLVKERLFARPSRPASYAAGGKQQLAASPVVVGLRQPGVGALSDYFSDALTLSPHEYTLAPLRRGAAVVAGTILGRVAGSDRLVLQIRPAGAGAPMIDPRPIVAGWKALGSLLAAPKKHVAADFAGLSGSADPSIGQLLLASKSELQRRVLADPRVNVYGCGRRDIEAGLVDRRVLAVTEYLSYSGLAPGVSGLVCGQPTPAGPAAGERVVINRVNGTPVAGHQQDGGVVDQAIRRLLALQGTLGPSQIVSLRTYPGQPEAISQPDHAGELEIDFGGAGSGMGTAGLDAAEWKSLIGRVGQLGSPSVTTSAQSVAGAAPVQPRAGGRPRSSRASATAQLPARVAGSPAVPVVTINAPATDWNTQTSLQNPVDVNGTTDPSKGINSVAIEASPARANQWSGPLATTTPNSDGTYDTTFDTTQITNGTGVYDIRAVASDGAGNSWTALAPDRVIANNATFVALQNPGTPLRGNLPLTATPAQGGATPTSVTFWRAPAGTADAVGTGAWTQIAPAGPQIDPATGSPTGNYVTTANLPDGSYDLGVTATDATPGNPGDQFIGNPVRGVMIDNTAPTATLDSASGSPFMTLTASAQDTGGSGIAAVKFESAPAGSGVWTPIGVATSSPYSTTFDTRQLTNGTYDFRVEATDFAGNIFDSPSVSSVMIANSSVQRFDNFTVTDFTAPATHISVLGERAGSPEHEAWAYGFTTAPPSSVDGTSPPPTQQWSDQLVLLRYTDATGWQIADVLRKADGGAWQPLTAAGQPATVTGQLSATGQMTASGEGWLAVSATGVRPAVFHRLPGGHFTEDTPTESANGLGSILGQGMSLRLGQAADGSVDGLVLAPHQNVKSGVTVPSAGGGTTAVNTALRYGVLSNVGCPPPAQSCWRVQSQDPPSDYVAPAPGQTLVIAAADPSGPGTGWAALETVPFEGSVNPTNGTGPLMLERFDPNGWSPVSTGLDVLDHTGPYSAGGGGDAAPKVDTVPTALRADSGGVWVAASIKSTSASAPGSVIARYDTSSGRVVASWCSGLPLPSYDCGQPLDSNHPAAVPNAVFDTPDGLVADAIGNNFVNVYAHGAWTTAPAPGFNNFSGQASFLAPDDGWLVGPNSLGRVSATPPASDLAQWPEPNRSPLLGVALPPGQSSTDTAGALAVGLDGTALHYDPAAGWLVDPTAPRAHHIGLLAVAFNGPSSAFAVGQGGIILHWDGASWSEDPQSGSVTTDTLNSVAFRSDGQGWAVGAFGTILHYDGSSWSAEQIDSGDSGTSVTSVAVAGNDVFAIAGGNLITRGPDGSWQPLPSPAPAGTLRLASGLPDGGLAVAGKSLLMVRQDASKSLQPAPNGFQGIPVALAAYRDSGGNVQAFVSVAPPVLSINGGTPNDVGGFPAGDGDLIVETGNGPLDLSKSQAASAQAAAPGDGAVHADPVLAVAASRDGTHAWAVGGYAGTHAADGVGTDAILPARPFGWRTSSIWRYDAGGSASAPNLAQDSVSLPAQPGTVSFAFFSSPLCKEQCAAAYNAQPDVNLRATAAQIAAFAQQPGGPAFAILGGNARGPIDPLSYQAGNGAVDLSRLPGLLSPLGGVPTYAAFGPLDNVPGSSDPALPWAEAFANAPAPFGSGGAPAGIAAAGSGDPTGPVNKYYAFDVSQNGGTLRVIVLDNSAGSLEASAPGQTAWLSGRLAEAQAVGRPVVVIAARPLNSLEDGAASDGDAVAAQLAAAGVLGVFTTSGGESGTWATESDRVSQIPANVDPTVQPQIPEYEGATLTYQQPQNNGVMWYDVSVDTSTPQLSVQAIPAVSALALQPLRGLSAARSSTLSFAAVGRRPPGTVATTPTDDRFPGFDQYVEIPAAGCGGCIGPSYSFTSSDPVVGDFVAATGPGSPYPKLNAKGQPVRSSTSGLFCAFNSGTTTVTVTAGLLSASLPVTVKAGGFGPPCGTVPGGTNTNVIRLPGRVSTRVGGNPNGNVGGAPQQGPAVSGALPKIIPPPPPAVVPPAVVPHKIPKLPVKNPVANPVQQNLPVPVQQTQNAIPPIVPPLIPPGLTPVPPGGATVSAQATARREEKARKHAQQSAFVTRPAGTSASDWFYPTVGVITVLALLLSAGGLRPGPRQRPALVELHDPIDRVPRRRR